MLTALLMPPPEALTKEAQIVNSARGVYHLCAMPNPCPDKNPVWFVCEYDVVNDVLTPLDDMLTQFDVAFSQFIQCIDQFDQECNWQ